MHGAEDAFSRPLEDVLNVSLAPRTGAVIAGNLSKEIAAAWKIPLAM